MPFWAYLPVYWIANAAGYRVHAYSLAEHYVAEADNKGFLDQLKALTDDVEADVLGFHAQGVEFFVAFGNSIGSELALACTKAVPAISVVVLNTMRGSTSEFLWNSPYGQAWKPLYEVQGYTEATLYNELRPVEACEHLDRLGNRRVLLYYSKADKTIPPYNTELFVKALAASGVKHHIIRNRYLGHFWASVKNHARFWVWLGFLRQAERRLRTHS
jgi:fermentation-respiration switch protein FrsA (DUF1100 family)